MQSIFAFIIIIVALAAFSFFGQPPKQEGELPQLQETLTQTQESASPKTQTFLESAKPAESVSESSEPKSTISINTHITSGPEEGEVIEKTNRVTFEFKAKTSPEEIEGRVIFETKMEGFDEDWKETSSNQRTITFPSGPKEYTFLVRAKIKDVADPTPAERTFKINTSLYFNRVKISSTRTKTSSRPSLITLRTYLKQGEEINITGWQIKGKRGSFVIPGGIEKYKPYYNPVPTEDIFIEQGDIIYLSGASNPFGRGRNFRPNKCLGYFMHYHDFPIPLSRNCPKPTEEEISHLDPCCQIFIQRLRRCEIPDYSCNLSVSGDPECTSYLTDNFNYGDCYRKYSKDEDFIGNNWHIYMNRNFIVSNDCDILYLRDQNGLFINKYSYGRAVCK